MIQHLVLLRFKASVQAEEKSQIYEALAGLIAIIPGIVDFKAGPNVSTEGLHGGFQDGFMVTFESADARDVYVAHPDHLAVGQRIVASTDGGLSGVLVFDFEM